MTNNPELRVPSSRRRHTLRTGARISLMIALVAAVWIFFIPSEPDFITHIGVITSAPDDEAILRLYYRYPRLKLADVTAVGLVLANGETLDAMSLNGDQAQLRMRQPSPAISLAPLRHLDIQFVPRQPGSTTILAVVISIAGEESTYQIGEISLVTYPTGEVGNRRTSTQFQFNGSPRSSEFSVHTQLPHGMVFRGFEPELGDAEIRLVGSGTPESVYDDYGWTVTISPRYWQSPTCVVYRPVVLTEADGVVTRTFGPDLAFIADMPPGARP